MNCRRVEKLIPLYVESELDPSRITSVMLHLKNCASCSKLSSEYRESQRWLRSSSVPEFEDEFFRELRAAVTVQLEINPNQNSWAELIFGRWRGRWALAAGVFLLIAGALVFYLRFNQTQIGSQEFYAGPSPQEDFANKPQQAAVGAPTNHVRDPKKFSNRASLSGPAVRKPPIIEMVAMDRILEREDRAVALVAELSMQIELIEPAEPPWPWFGSPAVLAQDQDGENADQSRTFGAGVKPASFAAGTRIEIQTADPAIRIIWFAPKENRGTLQNANDTE